MTWPLTQDRTVEVASDILDPTTSRPARTELPLSLAFFGHDTSDSAIIKRVKAFEEHGAFVAGFMFRRDRVVHTRAHWANVDLGVTRDLNYWRRLPKLASAVITAWVARKKLRSADVIYARNLDMLAVAAAAKFVSQSRAVIVYEALDIRRIMVGDAMVNLVFRALERQLMKTAKLIVVSSPGYMDHYFWPLQGYRGPWMLLENKVRPDAAAGIGVTTTALQRASGPPWIVGWFGVLKCPRSLDILVRLAEALPSKVIIHLRGITPNEAIEERVREASSRLANFKFFGPYANPVDLSRIYGEVHFTFAADYLDPGANSDWCLMNRFYEGGLYGSVALAAKSQPTGRLVERERLGFTVSEPVERTIVDFFETLRVEDYANAEQNVRAAPRSLFVDEIDTLNLLNRMAAVARPLPSNQNLKACR